MRFKKITTSSPQTTQLQSSEFAVMMHASSEHMCSGDCKNVSDIHQKLYISKAALSQTLGTLEKKGYIVRNINPEDRRKIMVTVTADGEVELEKATQLYNEMLDRILEQFGTEDTKTLIQLLERLTGILDAEELLRTT